MDERQRSKTDIIGRRKRTNRQPRGKSIYLRPRDFLWLEKIHHHGALPTQFLHAYSESLSRDYHCALKRMRDLYHEGKYLDRAHQQFDTYNAQCNQLVYDIGVRGKEVLQEEGLWSDYAPRAYGTWKHQCMVACITASLELGTIKHPQLRYIPQHEILARAKTTLRAKVSYRNPSTGREETRELVPDALCGIEYQQDRKSMYRFFIIEADRATEPNRTEKFDRKSIKRTVLQYREFIGHGLYKEHFNLKAGMVVLTVTTSERHMHHLIDVVREESKNDNNSFMLFQYVPTFGRFFKPPLPMYELLAKPWQRAGHQPFLIHQP